MKGLALIGLIGTLLTGMTPGMTPAAGCPHDHITFLPDGTRFSHGYSHSYNTSQGIKGCNVTVYYIYTRVECNSCHAVVQSFKSGETELHSEPDHK